MPQFSRPFSRLDRRSALTLFGAFLADAAFTPTMLRAELSKDWTTPMPPYRIAGNLYYVGSRDLASFLVTSPQGHILINSNLATSPGQIRASVEKLGFHFKDIRILTISHAHFDHCAGSSQIKKETGARYLVMDADVPVVESGGQADFHFGSDLSMRFLPAKVDQILHDGDSIRLGGNLLTAHKTAGHTKGCTTFTMELAEDGKTSHVVIVGGPFVLSSYNLIDDKNYPQMATDFAQQFRVLKALPCDIFVGAHGGYYDMLEKYASLQAGNKNAFVDPSGYQQFVADCQQAFETMLTKQQNARQHPPKA
jgi:metallo-beta-lactamase class B